MAIAVIMPRQGQSVESCVIGTWHKSPGDKVAVGDLLFTYETDKAAFEEESKVEGTLLALFFQEGDDVPCLTNVCVIGAEGESVDEFKPVSAEDHPRAAEDGRPYDGHVAEQSLAATVPVLPSVAVDNLPQGDPYAPQGAGVFPSAPISPRARKLAEKTGADISRAEPTGANGRIIERDIQKVIDAGFLGTRSVTYSFGNAVPTGLGGRVTVQDLVNIPLENNPPNNTPAISSIWPDSEDVPLTNVRKFIAKAMHTSLANSAQLTHHSSFDATDILNFRKNLKSLDRNHPTSVRYTTDVSKITITDIIIYATARVLQKHKAINAHFLDDKIRVFNNAHIGVAVDTPRGLLVPTLFTANGHTLSELSLYMKQRIDECKNGSIAPDLLKGATFTISNLGAMGVEMFTPVLNPPQVGILGVCSIVERCKNGKFYPAMGLSLTYDHRALDGADAARFQKDLVDFLENFSFNLAVARGM
ncbi:MAG: 2-oxo acid dehydrogenase subunit E2 [Oscillospiraceae bacterium]|nr:2-oxo acid dehydrogenase subunit E2 [Oscillospiraceae bacterium]MCL2278985.1 2-oxo acid dehydrogenase subunit E2 [Oscillospiraceae bacterium]